MPCLARAVPCPCCAVLVVSVWQCEFVCPVPNFIIFVVLHLCRFRNPSIAIPIVLVRRPRPRSQALASRGEGGALRRGLLQPALPVLLFLLFSEQHFYLHALL